MRRPGKAQRYRQMEHTSGGKGGWWVVAYSIGRPGAGFEPEYAIYAVRRAYNEEVLRARLQRGDDPHGPGGRVTHIGGITPAASKQQADALAEKWKRESKT